jgi:hypothetical protein
MQDIVIDSHDVRGYANIGSTRFALVILLSSTACMGGVGDSKVDGGDGTIDARSQTDAFVDAAPPPPYPDETVTGWTPTGTFTTLTGTQTISVAGTEMHDIDLGGCLVIAADNVTVRRVRIRCQGTGITVQSGSSNVTIEDVTVDGEGAGTMGVSVIGNSLDHTVTTGVLRRLDIHGYKRGIRIQVSANVTVEDSYVHAPVPCKAPADNDMAFYQINVASSDAVTIRHNHFDRGGEDTCTGSDSSFGAHPAYLVQAYGGSVFENNLVNGGSAYCTTIKNTCKDLAVRNNHFGSDPHATCATKGAADATYPISDMPDNPNENCTWTGNVWDATGSTVPSPT